MEAKGLELNVTRNPKMAKFYLGDPHAEFFNDAAKFEQPDFELNDLGASLGRLLDCSRILDAEQLPSRRLLSALVAQGALREGRLESS